MSQFCYLVPVVTQVVNGQSASGPKYYGTDFTGSFASIPYGLEPLCLLTLPRASSALQQESDIYTFNPDLTVPMSDEDAATLEGFLNANNLPSDGIISGLPFVTALVYVAQIHLLAQYIASSTSQVGSLFANGVTLSSPISDSASITSAVSAAQSAQASQGVGNVGIGTGGSGGSSGGSDGSSSGPFDFAIVSDFTPMGEFLDSASQTWAGGPISLGGF